MIVSKSRGMHSHIKGLGLDDCGNPIESSDDIIGQEDAREAAGLIVEMVRTRKMSGRAILLSGPSGAGKTALAVAISEELGCKTPFTAITGSEVYSAEVKKTEILQEALRRSILVRIKEFKDIYEGEVVSIDIKEEDNLLCTKKIISEINVTLRSTKGTKAFKISSSLFEQIDQQNITVGDVIYIESSAGIIKKMGRGESYMNDFDLEAERYVPLPKGDIYKRKEIIQETTLHELDCSNVKPTGQDIISLVSQILSPKKCEITDKLRNEVNMLVNNYLEVGKAEIVPGVLFIDEVQMLDLECATYLHKAIESPLSPIIIFASNKKESVYGSKDDFKFGLPKDLVDRLVIIPVKKNKLEEEIKIMKMRFQEEEINICKDGIDLLSEVCQKRSLRYCLSVIPLLKTFKDEVLKRDVEEIIDLFHDC